MAIASAHTSFLFDFDVEDMNSLRTNLRKDKVFSPTYKTLTEDLSALGISNPFTIINGVLYWHL